jgi:chromosome segregation ATPase
LKSENEESAENLAILRDEKNMLEQENKQLKAEATHLKQEKFIVKAKLCKAEEVIQSHEAVLPMIYKESRKKERLAMIGTVLVSVIGVIMRKCQVITRIRTLCEAIFDNNLFEAIPTERFLNQYSKMYCRKYVYLPMEGTSSSRFVN